MLIKMQCSNCGAELEADSEEKYFFCRHCGTKILNVAEKIEVNHTINNIDLNKDNVFIVFTTLVPNMKMISQVNDTGRQDIFVHGQEAHFHLSQGFHELTFFFGSSKFVREIFIREDNAPVRISVSFIRNAPNISIDQPEYYIEKYEAESEEIPYEENVTPENDYYDDNRKPRSVFGAISIPIAFVSLLFLTWDLFSVKDHAMVIVITIFAIISGIVSLLLALRSLKDYKKVCNPRNCVTGIVLSCIALVISVIVLIANIAAVPQEKKLKQELSQSEIDTLVSQWENSNSVDYSTAEKLEKDLNKGKDAVGKTVTFEVLEVKPDSALGFNLYAGEHLNFTCKDSFNVKAGDKLTVLITYVGKVLGSWELHYVLLDGSSVGKNGGLEIVHVGSIMVEERR